MLFVYVMYSTFIFNTKFASIHLLVKSSWFYQSQPSLTVAFSWTFLTFPVFHISSPQSAVKQYNLPSNWLGFKLMHLNSLLQNIFDKKSSVIKCRCLFLCSVFECFQWVLFCSVIASLVMAHRFLWRHLNVLWFCVTFVVNGLELYWE